ncbi:lytic transglycosylase domain-containing protein [Micromonospora sp. SH-82]|uniref:aggregation-promoting factor C-terminal-like domain-containing protein n=1 Tax=Micromonospora sp. SH-82 TaxID=3132938 RepID=UPI003EBAEC9B
MSRLWSRLGARTAAVALLSVGVAGGFYLGENQETEQQGTIARVAVEVDKTEHEYQRERQARHQVRSAQQRGAEYQAKLRAAKAAKEAAERAKEAERAAAARKKEREEAERKKAEEEKAEKEAARASRPFEGPVPDSCTEFSGNRRTGCSMMVQAGFGMDQFPCLNKLWNKESGWNHLARNPSSGAYGIPQSYPGNKMASVGSDWQTNPVTQIKWGLNYIEGRYNTPCRAWQQSQNTGSY